MSVFDDLPPGPVQPLSCTTLTGEPYKRFASVERQIGGVLGIPESEWEPILRHAQPETLIHLVRFARRRGLKIYQELLTELSRRTTALAEKWARGMPEDDKADAVADVVCEILQLAVSLEQTRQAEFLEVAFIPAVQSRTVDKFRDFERAAERSDNSVPEFSGDDTNAQHPVDYVPDESPNPETAAIMRQLVDIAFAAIKNKKHAKAVYLFYVEGWPVYCANPKEPSLSRLFRKDPRIIRQWIDKATAAMREELEKIGVRGAADLSSGRPASGREASTGGQDAKTLSAGGTR